MAKSTSLNVTQTIKTPSKQLVNADGTSAFSLVIGASGYTMSADQGILKALTITSTDTAAQTIQVIINDGTNDRVLGTVPVPAGAGTNGSAAAVDALSTTWIPGLLLDQNGKAVLPLGASYVVKVKSPVAVTAAKAIDVIAVIEEY